LWREPRYAKQQAAEPDGWPNIDDATTLGLVVSLF
jgi:hypothetical protein